MTSTGKAQFRLEQTGKNDIPSNVIISSDASQDSGVMDPNPGFCFQGTHCFPRGAALGNPREL